MAKRLTDSTKWNDNWFTNLPMDMKLVWIYLLDSCDHAGVYKVNLRLLRFQTDCNRTESEIINYLKDRIYIKNDKWFIPKFISFQYKNFFTSNTPAIKSARELLISHMIIEPNDNSFDKITKELNNHSITLIEPLSNGYITTKDKDKDTDKDKIKDFEKDMYEYMDIVFDKEKEEDEEFKKDMHEYMDEIFDKNKTPNKNTGLVEKIVDRIIQYKDTKLHRNALEDLQDLGGIDKVSEILQWDESVKQNHIRAINQAIQIHNDK